VYYSFKYPSVRDTVASVINVEKKENGRNSYLYFVASVIACNSVIFQSIRLYCNLISFWSKICIFLRNLEHSSALQLVPLVL
jgi:hypothetical protein